MVLGSLRLMNDGNANSRGLRSISSKPEIGEYTGGGVGDGGLGGGGVPRGAIRIGATGVRGQGGDDIN